MHITAARFCRLMHKTEKQARSEGYEAGLKAGREASVREWEAKILKALSAAAAGNVSLEDAIAKLLK